MHKFYFFAGIMPFPRRHPEFFLATKVKKNREQVREKVQDPSIPLSKADWILNNFTKEIMTSIYNEARNYSR